MVTAGGQDRWEEFLNPSGPLPLVLAPASLPNVRIPPLPRRLKGEFDNHLNDGITNVIFRANMLHLEDLLCILLWMITYG